MENFHLYNLRTQMFAWP